VLLARILELWQEDSPDKLQARRDSGKQDDTISKTVHWHDGCIMDGVLFRTASSQEHLLTDNSGVMLPFRARANANQTFAYGEIIQLMEHRLDPGGPALVLAEVAWMKMVDEKHLNRRMPIVQRHPNNLWNTTELKYESMEKFVAQNVVFFPKNAKQWNTKGPLCAIYREAGTHQVFPADHDNHVLPM
jgi:hypothetical protein